MAFDQKVVFAFVGWALAAAASVALVVQHQKTQQQQQQWQSTINEQQARIVELEVLIADLYLAKDESGTGVSDAASKTGTAISNVFQRVRERLKREN